ncbi:Mix paired-like homeobox [Gonapodya sp. JEL0774]|nr:Mix paired-like homeobox [Gonapodya sp. JEL0774]
MRAWSGNEQSMSSEYEWSQHPPTGPAKSKRGSISQTSKSAFSRTTAPNPITADDLANDASCDYQNSMNAFDGGHMDGNVDAAIKREAQPVYPNYPTSLPELLLPPLPPHVSAPLEMPTHFVADNTQPHATTPEHSPNSAATNPSIRPRVFKYPRKKTTPDQLEILVRVFEETDNPDFFLRERISAMTGMANKEVQIWFQNRRAKLLREARRNGTLRTSPSTETGLSGGGPIRHSHSISPTFPIVVGVYGADTPRRLSATSSAGTGTVEESASPASSVSVVGTPVGNRKVGSGGGVREGSGSGPAGNGTAGWWWDMSRQGNEEIAMGIGVAMEGLAMTHDDNAPPPYPAFGAPHPFAPIFPFHVPHSPPAPHPQPIAPPTFAYTVPVYGPVTLLHAATGAVPPDHIPQPVHSASSPAAPPPVLLPGDATLAPEAHISEENLFATALNESAVSRRPDQTGEVTTAKPVPNLHVDSHRLNDSQRSNSPRKWVAGQPIFQDQALSTSLPSLALQGAFREAMGGDGQGLSLFGMGEEGTDKSLWRMDSVVVMPSDGKGV